MAEDPQQEQVRRLLADARHGEPMPDDVAGRLDDVLADLREDRPVRPGVVDLAAARRRRRARGLLVAAAAVVVVGVGFDRVRDGASSDSSDSTNSAVMGDAEDSTAGGSGRKPAEDDAEAGGGAGFQAETQDADPPAPLEAPADGLDAELDFYYVPQSASRVASEEFGRDALRIRDRAVRLRAADATGDQRSLAKTRCRDQGWGAGRAVFIRYDASPAVLVYRPVRGDTQVVDLFLCGRDDPTRSITLPAP